MEIKDGPAEANLMDAPEMAVTPAPAAGQLRQSPDGANSSVIDATSTCGGAGGGRGSVANLDNVVDEETAETPLLVSMKLIHYQGGAIRAFFSRPVRPKIDPSDANCYQIGSTGIPVE